MLFLINEELIMENEEFLSEWDSSFSERSEVFFILHCNLFHFQFILVLIATHIAHHHLVARLETTDDLYIFEV